MHLFYSLHAHQINEPELGTWMTSSLYSCRGKTYDTVFTKVKSDQSSVFYTKIKNIKSNIVMLII